MSLSSRRLVLPLLTAAATITPVWSAPLQMPATEPSLGSTTKTVAPSASGLALNLRRTNGAVEVVIQGAGAGPVLQQRSSGGVWNGDLSLAGSTSLRFGAQRMTLPEAGLQAVSLNGSGSSYQLQVVPMPGYPLSKPVVSADGQNLVISFAAASEFSQQSARLDLRQPGSVPQPTYAPPMQPRAVAPPLGDMAVGSMVLRNPGFVTVSGPNVTLNLRNAPAKEALMAIAQLGGYGFSFVADAPAGADPTAASFEGRPVTVSFRNESYSRALNTVLLAAGLQGKREGNLLLAGPNVLSKTFGAQVSKVYRLNQASAASAADYLASLGASITKVNVITNTVAQGTPQADQVSGAATSQQTQTQKITTTETYGGGVGPLKGLLGTTDSRLQTITLIGDASVVAVAESYLRQIDLRQRQVALTVRILDITLDNNAGIENSFSFRWGNNFIVNDGGKLLASFGRFADGSGASSAAFGNDRNSFYDFVRAQIVSQNTKVLASPTLILSENPDPLASGGAVGLSSIGSSGGSSGSSGSGSGGGSGGSDSGLSTATIGRPFSNEAFVTVGSQVVTSYDVVQGQNGASNTCEPQFSTAGLTFGARISKIDDNGFVTFSLSPAVSAITGEDSTGSGDDTCGKFKILSFRRLDTGTVRVRDGQTLILTGVISDTDIQSVTKWPILGDIPLIGQFFRSTGNQRKKNELVIMVTPRIIDDERGGSYGYGYTPVSAESRQLTGGSI